MTVELGGFWRKPTDVGERLEEVPKRLKGVRMCVEERRGRQVFFLVLEEEDQTVRRD
jgi:hypothetical protein